MPNYSTTNPGRGVLIDDSFDVLAQPEFAYPELYIKFMRESIEILSRVAMGAESLRELRDLSSGTLDTLMSGLGIDDFEVCCRASGIVSSIFE
jgi:hypothetical protein